MADRTTTMAANRRSFTVAVYLLLAAQLILAVGQWCVFACCNFMEEWAFVFHIVFCLGLLLLVLFIFFEALRFQPVVNWVMAILIFECVVVGMGPFVVRHYFTEFLASCLLWTLVLIIFILIGSFVPMDLTLDVVVLFVLSVISTIGAIYFLMIYIVFNSAYCFWFARAFIIISIWMVGTNAINWYLNDLLTIFQFVMYHAQIINGYRFAEMRTKDYLLGSLLLFLDFLLLLIFSFQLATRWSDKCDKELENGQKLFLFQTPTTST
ncbi:hypothetical protein KR018_002248, partial [Drosophila ironensis]